MLDFQPDDYIELNYPTTTHIRLIGSAPRQLRKLTIRRIRDLTRQPLTINEFFRRPYVMRSRWLVLGYDHDRAAWRQFYLGSSDEFASPGQLRLALYEPGSTRPAQILGREFNPTVFDRKLMMRLIRRWNDPQHDDGLELRVCCDDLRIVG